MARQVYAFSVTVAPGSTPDAPVMSALALPVLEVDEVRLRVPPGPSGQLGIALAVGGQQIIPYQAGTFLVADNEVIDFPLSDFPQSGAWDLVAYNLGRYPHTVQVTFYLSLLAAPPPLPPPPLPASVLVGP